MSSNDPARRLTPARPSTTKRPAELSLPSVQKAEPRRSILPWLIAGVTALFLVCTGVIGIGSLLWWKSRQAPSPPTAAVADALPPAPAAKQQPVAVTEKANVPQKQQEIKTPAPQTVPPPQPKPTLPAKEGKPSDAPPILVRNCVNLHHEFADNPVAADKKYAGKLIRIQEPVSFAEQVDKRTDGFWIMEAIGIASIEFQAPVYGVEYKLSEEGEDQYAKSKKEDLAKMELIGRVKGTRPYSPNRFARIMIQIVDCHFVPADPENNPRLRAEREAAMRREQEERRKQEEAKHREEETKRQAELLRKQQVESKAQAMLNPALKLLQRGFKKQAIERLQQVIEKYPDTEAAEKAKKILAKEK